MAEPIAPEDLSPAASAPRLTWPPVSYWLKVAAGVIVLMALSRAVLAIGNVLVLLLVSFVLAVGFQPAISWLEKRGVSRGWAVAIIFLSGVGVIGAFLALVLPAIVKQIADLVAKAPDYLAEAQSGSGFIADINERFDLQAKLQDIGSNLPTTALSLVRSITAFVFNTLTVAILTVYFMGAMPRLRTAIARLLKPDDREEFEEIATESIQRVGGYVLGNILISVIAGVVSFTALVVIGVPYAVALAFWVALADLVPTVGAILGALACVLVAAFTGTTELVTTAIFFAIYQQIENYVIAPRVMKRAIDMSAAAVIVAVLIGGSLAGFVGALLALPIAAIIKITIRELYLERRMVEVDRADSELKGPSGRRS